MRKLASIQRIQSLEPIPEANAIEVARVLGWQLVVKKGEFQVNDLCVYFEIDSILPERSEFEFLRSKHFRVKTIKLRGQISQGICFPLTILPQGVDIEEGKDLTEILGVKLFEPPIPFYLAGKKKGQFPEFIPKTDEPRVQNLIDILKSHHGEKCYITEKLDGSSITIFLKNGYFGVCSRNFELEEDEENSLWKLVRELDIENKLKQLNGNFALQGEAVGKSIQKNTLNLKGHTIYFFNVYDIDNKCYLGYSEFKETIQKIGLQTVPILNENYILNTDIKSLVELSIGKSLINKEGWREGIIIRPLTEKKLEGERFSFKIINHNFLLKYDE
jgi:RNA ligase (TIGR02306 family)